MASSNVGKEPNTTNICCDDEDCQMLENPNFVDESYDTIEPQTKKAKALTSYVWIFFFENQSG